MMLFIPVTPLSIISTLIYRLINKQWPLNGKIIIKRDGVYLFGRKDDFIDLLLLDEPKTYVFIKNFCKKFSNCIFLDIGAHVGAYTVPLAKMGVKVIAIEPSPLTYRYLENNVKVNNLGDNVSLHNVAIFNKTGHSWLYHSSLHSGADSLVESNGDNKTLVKTITLKYLLNNYDNIQIAKMDIEGLELKVLKKAEEEICKIKVWVIEVRNNTYFEVTDLFIEKGYKSKIIEELIGSKGIFNVVYYK